MGHTGSLPEVGLSEALVAIAGGLGATRQLGICDPGENLNF